MHPAERLNWESRHATGSAVPPLATAAFLPRADGAHAVALDIACGKGRHVAILRRLGYRVVALDFACNALAAIPRDPLILRVAADTRTWPVRPSAFDLVCQTNFLDRTLLPALLDTVRPGGTIWLETFLTGEPPNVAGPRNPDHLLQPGELETLFSGWRIRHRMRCGPPTRRAGIVAQRPR